MRIYVDLVLFLSVSSVCGFSNRQVMERLGNYIEDRMNAESKFRRDDFGTLLSEIGAIKTIMLQQSQENKSEKEDTDSTEATEKSHSQLAKEVKILTNDFKEEKTLNARFRREIPQLHKHVKDLKTKTDQISASLEDILNGIEFLKEQNGKRQESYNLIDNAIPEIQTNILDLHKQFEQRDTAGSESLDKIRNDIGEMNNRIEHLNCTVFSCPVISTPSSESPMTTCKSSTSSPNNLKTTYKSCLDLYRNGFKSSAVYEIEIEHERRLSVYCDMTTDGGGWTVFQRRQDGSVDFYRDWNDYKTGFGDLTGEFWLGNEYLNLLTDNDEPHELRIDLEDHDGNHAFAKYNSFKVRSESMNYKLEVSGYTGTAGDSLFSISAGYGPHNEMEFSTKDKDNDKYGSENCASRWHGAWWFNGCFDSHLNGLYRDKANCAVDCIIWHSWKGYNNSMKFTEMKVR